MAPATAVLLPCAVDVAQDAKKPFWMPTSPFSLSVKNPEPCTIGPPPHQRSPRGVSVSADTSTDPLASTFAPSPIVAVALLRKHPTLVATETEWSRLLDLVSGFAASMASELIADAARICGNSLTVAAMRTLPFVVITDAPGSILAVTLSSWSATAMAPASAPGFVWPL